MKKLRAGNVFFLTGLLLLLLLKKSHLLLWTCSSNYKPEFRDWDWFLSQVSCALHHTAAKKVFFAALMKKARSYDKESPPGRGWQSQNSIVAFWCGGLKMHVNDWKSLSQELSKVVQFLTSRLRIVSGVFSHQALPVRSEKFSTWKPQTQLSIVPAYSGQCPQHALQVPEKKSAKLLFLVFTRSRFFGVARSGAAANHDQRWK